MSAPDSPCVDVEPLVRLCCALLGHQVSKGDAAAARPCTLHVSEFTVHIEAPDVRVYNRASNASFTFLDIAHRPTAEIFSCLFRGWQEILGRPAPLHGLLYTLVPANIPRFPELDIVQLALMAGALCGAVRISAQVHRLRLRFWVADTEVPAFHWRYALEFSGTLASARCLSCSRVRRVPMLRPRLRRGWVTHAENLLLFFYLFLTQHRHLEMPLRLYQSPQTKV